VVTWRCRRKKERKRDVHQAGSGKSGSEKGPTVDWLKRELNQKRKRKRSSKKTSLQPRGPQAKLRILMGPGKGKREARSKGS